MTPRPKAGKESSKKKLSDFGNGYLSKRKSLKPEIGSHGGAVRVRVIDTDALTVLYHRRLVSDVQYSIGMSYLKDYWQAGLSGKPAQNLEANTSAGHHSYIPYGVGAMLRFQKASSHLLKMMGERSVSLVIKFITDNFEFTKKEVEYLRDCLDSLGKFYQGYSPSSKMDVALAD